MFIFIILGDNILLKPAESPLFGISAWEAFLRLAVIVHIMVTIKFGPKIPDNATFHVIFSKVQNLKDF